MASSSFRLYFAICFAMMASAMADITALVGEWKVAEIYDTLNDLEPRELPTSTGGPFVFKLTPKGNDEDTLILATRIGNSMRTSINVLNDDAATGNSNIKVGLVIGTKMMPAPDLYELETFLSEALPKMDTMTVSADGQEMVMTGTSKIVLEAVETTDV
eukprot:CAMPEP_0178762348 /NCGR_PEP_ID=MMETSP0744-20121128/16486_1 /TAXON_ID=913974 /ORGANISM="Nitzschia punctata, Strain CCMP561" /LENGTH=158 /DNA_ID=CAMNT_0020417003 /DNA_START=170 /DNA_END=646 /DNA_ORIENTATION=+